MAIIPNVVPFTTPFLHFGGLVEGEDDSNMLDLLGNEEALVFTNHNQKSMIIMFGMLGK